MVRKTKAQEAPTAPLPAPLNLKSLEEVDEALKELAALGRIESQAKARCAEIVAAATARCESKLMVMIDGKPVTVTDRRTKLREDVAAFVVANREWIFTDEKKSRDLNFGRIGFKLSQASIEVLPAKLEGQKSAWELFAAKVFAGITKALATMRLGLGAGSKAAQVLRVKVEPDRVSMMKGYRGGTLTDANLAKVGARYMASVDTFFFEPKAEELKSHETAPASSEAA